MKERRKILLPSIKVALKIYAVVLTICIVIFGMQAVITNKNHITNWLASKNLKLTYEEVGENDNNTQNSYVKFDAYFLEKSGSTTKKLRGKASDLNDRQELQLELNVLTNGHLENGKIVLNSENYKVARAIVADNVIKSVYSNYTDIRLNDVQNGTYKTIPVLIEQTVVSGKEGNKNKLSNINSVTFTGTHVAEDGTRTKIEKTVNFKIDWYGNKKLEEIRLSKTAYVASRKDDKVIIGLQAKMWSQDYNDTYIQVPDKAAILNSTIPMLNGYAPKEVTVTDGSNPARKLTYTYNKSTRKLEVRSEVKYDENGIGERIIFGSAYLINIAIEYPYIAYQTLGANAKSLSITASGYLEGHNNPNQGFTNPVKSLIGNKTVNINLRGSEVGMIEYDAEIDLLTKSKLRLKYDRNTDTDNGYRVTWNAKVNYIGNIEKLIYEDNNEADKMQETNGNYNSLENIVTYKGIKIPETSMKMLEDNGYVKVINAETGETIKLITKNDADKYIEYEQNVKHIKIETSKLKQTGEFKIYNYKKIDNEKFVNKYTKSQFNNMSLVHTTLNGKTITNEEEQFVNKDIGTADYEDGTNLIYVVPTVQLNTQRLNEKTISIDLKQYSYTEDRSLAEWVDPSIILEYPQEIEEIRINKIYSGDGELKLKQVTQEVINGKKIIRIKMEGVTKSGSSVKVEQNIKMNPKTNLATGQLRTFAYNELCDQWHYIYSNTQEVADIYDINKDGNKTELRNISVTELIYSRPTGLNTTTEALNFDSKGSTVMGPDIAEVEKQEIGREATIRLNVYNNYNTPVTKAKIVGKIPFKGNTYQINGANIGSTFTTQMKENGIILPNSLQGKAKVYYSEKETVNENITDSANEWTSTPRDWSKVKTYLIDLSAIEMATGDMYTIDYKINFPETLTYGTVSYATHAIYFEEQTTSGKVPRSTETNKVGFSISTPKKYELQITKLQQYTDKKVQGVRYKITGAGINEKGITYTTNAEGKITIKNLFPEEIYTLEETYAPNNYIKAEEKLQIQTYIENGELKARIIKGKIKGNPVIENATSDTATIKIDIENEAKYDLQIVKYQCGTTKPIKGARFTIKGKGYESGKILETNSEGKFKIVNLYPNETYTLQETSAPIECILETKPVVFSVNDNTGTLNLQVAQGELNKEHVIDQETRTVNITIENKVKYNLQITKNEMGTTKTIQGVKFNIKGKGFKETGETITTDSQGKITLTNLYPNETYTLQEIETPYMYVLNTNPVAFSVNDDNGTLNLQVTQGELRKEAVINQETRTVDINIENTAKCNLQITKYEIGTTRTIEGAKFNIKGKGLEEEGKIIVTDSEGKLNIPYLYPNETYTLQEIEAPADYEINKTPIVFVINDDNNNLTQQVISGKFKETPTINQETRTIEASIEDEIKYGIKVTKYEKETNKTIPNVQFVINGKDMTEEGKHFTTQSNGSTKILRLELGETYTIKETYAKGYYVDQTEGTIKLTRVDGELQLQYNGRNLKGEPRIVKDENNLPMVEIDFENKKIERYNLELTKIAEKTGKLLQGAKFEIEGAGRDYSSEKEYITAENGKLRIEDLYENEEYTLTEVQAPLGYKTSKEPVKFKASKQEENWVLEIISGSFYEETIIEKDTINVKWENKILFKLEKIDRDTQKKLEGAKFIIQDLEGNNAKNPQGDEIGTNENINGTDMRVITTDKEGMFTAEIAPGLYKITEVQAPFGYETEELPEKYFGIGASSEGSKGGRIDWFTRLGSDRNDVVERVVPTKDGGSLIAGYFTSDNIKVGDYTLSKLGSGALDNTAFVIKYDKDNQVKWATSIGGESPAFIYGITETKDEGFVVAGQFQSEVLKDNNGNILLTKKDNELIRGMTLKYDKNMKLQWARVSETEDKINAIIETEDEKILTVGNNGKITKYDNDGTVIWEKQAEGNITAISKTSDGGFIEGGNLDNDTVFAKHNSEGEQEWKKIINGAYICAVTETSDTHHYTMAGYMKSGIDITLENGKILKNNGATDGLIIQYDEEGNFEWGKNYGGASSEIVNFVAPTRDNGIITVGSLSSNITFDDKQIQITGTMQNALFVKYNNNGKVEWTKTIGGEAANKFTSGMQLKDGKFLVGMYTGDNTITLEDGTSYYSNGGIDISLIKIEETVKTPEISETQELTFENIRIKYKITTDVEGIGGTISGQGLDRYEVVKYEGNSVKDIITTPKEGYAISKITINGTEIPIIKNEDGSVKLDKFTNMSEDKHIVVSFTANPAEVIVHHYIDGTTNQVPLSNGNKVEDEHIYGEIGKEYATKAKTDLEKYILVESKLPANARGTMDKELTEVTYYYKLKDAKVIVHHYIDGTTTPVPLANGTNAQDEEIHGQLGTKYETEPQKNLDKYELVQEKLPANARGTMEKELTEVTYYYKLKDAKVIVHHYIDGTTTKVPLPDGTEATDEEIPGQLGMEYETNPKIDLDKYELVQDKLPTNARGTMDNEVTEVTYYYKLKDAKVIVHHYIEDTTTPVPLPDGTSIPDDEITGKIDDPYETEHKKDLEGYEVVTEKLPENKEGTMTKDPIEVIYYYKLKQVKITTEVEGVGGTISGQNENPYEEVKYNQDSIKDIKIVPDKNYRVSRITINGEEIEYEENMDRTVELPLFKEMREDKHIVVSFEKIPAGKVIVKYLEYGTEKELADQEEQTGNVGDPYETRRKEIEGYKTYGTDPINASGDLKEEEQQVIYYYTRITGTVIVKYIDIDTGEEIERQEMISGNAGDEYSTKSLIKDIEKYKLVEEEVKNETGTYIDGIIEVVYKYQKIPARVIVKYLEEGTNKELAKEEEVVGVENDPYDVTELEKEIKGYDRTKDIPANKEGGMTKEDITVIYYYTRKQAQITDEITKSGTDKILLPTNSPRAEYEITYSAEIHDYMGNAKITITDKLPYAIDEENSNLADGIYDNENKTITWNETIENIDTYENGNKQITITKNIEVVYKNVDYSKEKIINKAIGKIELDTTKQSKETDEVEKETVFEKPEIELETNIIKTGDEKVTDENTNIYYEIKYTGEINNFIGKAKIKIVDQLPYEIDEEKSSLDGGKYNKENKTITWEEIIEGIDTYKALDAKILNRTKVISLKYIYTNEALSSNIDNKVKVTTDLLEKESDEENLVKTEEKQDDHRVIVEIPSKVIVHHYIYDSEKQEYTSTKVAEDEVKEGNIGENYTTKKSKKVPKNYEVLDETPDKHEGKITKDIIEVIYYYQLKQETITNEVTKTAQIELLTQDGGKIDYIINSKVTIKDYIGKAKITIKDMLPAKINVSKSDLANGHYDAQINTITWNETVEDIDTFAKGTYEKNITKKISVVYEGQNKVSDLKNTVTSSIATYYPENHTTKPNEEKQTITKQDEETVKQEYKTNKTVEKVWNDNDDKKGNRPNSIKIQLTANGQEDLNGAKLEETILSEENAWTHTFADLPKYDSLGNKIEYSVKESEVNKNDLEYYEEAQISNLDKIIVTNNYKLTNTEIERTIEKEGTEEITKKDQEVNYHIKYSAVIKDYIGEATVTIVDLLPCKIDETKSNLQGGEYNEDTQTITWKQELGHINTTQNETEKQEGKKITIEKDIKVVYKNLDTTLEKITNIVRGKIEFTQNDSKNEVENSHDTIINVKGKVIVKYVEKDSKKEIATREEKEDKVGKEYSTEQKTIYGYTYVENSGNTVGTIKEGTTEVIYYYEKTDAGKVTVKYVDEEGNEIAKKEIEEGKIGDPYETKQKEIENYELEKVTGDETKGTLGENEKEVIYHYKKIKAKVIVRYLEKGSNKELLAEEEKQGYVGEKYETERKPIKDYRKAEPEPLNKEGKMTKETIYVTYYYEKIPSGKITVKYVDIDTKEEITYKEKDETKTYGYEQSGYVGEKYKTQEKQIPYYEYLSYLEPTNKEGNYKQEDDTIIYYYRKLPFNIKVDKKVKEASIDNQKAKIEKDGKIIKMDIIASKANKAKVEIRYEITVTNTGKIEGKTKVTDKIPEGFEISKQNASYWNKTANNTIETQVELKPGESKKLEVILIWKNQNDNFGTKINNVMITDMENPANYEETDKKDNVSVATVVISVKTGAQEKILATAISAIISSGLLVLLYQYERYQKERNREIRHLVLEGKNVVIKKKRQK